VSSPRECLNQIFSEMRPSLGMLKSTKAQFIIVRLPMAMCFFAACSSINCFADTRQGAIHVGSTVAISADSPTVPLAETWLDANPRNSKNMIAVSMAFPKEGAWASVMYCTLDGAKSWQRATHGPGHETYF
jgi:hypothetical protein